MTATAMARADVWARLPEMDVFKRRHLMRLYRRLGDGEREAFDAWLRRHLRVSARWECEIDPNGLFEAIKDAKDGILETQ